MYLNSCEAGTHRRSAVAKWLPCYGAFVCVLRERLGMVGQNAKENTLDCVAGKLEVMELLSKR